MIIYNSKSIRNYMINVRELDPSKQTESWITIPINSPQQQTALISMKDDAMMIANDPPNEYPKYFFKKGAVVLLLPNNDMIYNPIDLLQVQREPK